MNAEIGNNHPELDPDSQPLVGEASMPETKESEIPEPSTEELAQALENVLSEEDCEEIAGMGMEDALGYAFTLLLEQGVEDPEAWLKEKGVLE